MQRDFGPDRYAEIPPHGRWEHFSIGGTLRLEILVQTWQDSQVDNLEITRRLIDLFFVSVLLDAGAGDTWSFREPGSDQSYGRSEGIAVASLYMFTAGAFSSTTDGNKAAVDGKGFHPVEEMVIGVDMTARRTWPEQSHGRRFYSPLPSWPPESNCGRCIQNRAFEQFWKVSSFSPGDFWRSWPARSACWYVFLLRGLFRPSLTDDIPQTFYSRMARTKTSTTKFSGISFSVSSFLRGRQIVRGSTTSPLETHGPSECCRINLATAKIQRRASTRSTN